MRILIAFVSFIFMSTAIAGTGGHAAKGDDNGRNIPDFGTSGHGDQFAGTGGHGTIGTSGHGQQFVGASGDDILLTMNDVFQAWDINLQEASLFYGIGVQEFSSSLVGLARTSPRAADYLVTVFSEDVFNWYVVTPTVYEEKWVAPNSEQLTYLKTKVFYSPGDMTYINADVWQTMSTKEKVLVSLVNVLDKSIGDDLDPEKIDTFGGRQRLINQLALVFLNRKLHLLPTKTVSDYLMGFFKKETVHNPNANELIKALVDSSGKQTL